MVHRSSMVTAAFRKLLTDMEGNCEWQRIAEETDVASFEQEVREWFFSDDTFFGTADVTCKEMVYLLFNMLDYRLLQDWLRSEEKDI